MANSSRIEPMVAMADEQQMSVAANQKIEITPEQLHKLLELVQNAGQNTKTKEEPANTNYLSFSTVSKIAALTLFTYAVYQWGRANGTAPAAEPSELGTGVISYDPNYNSGITGFFMNKLTAAGAAVATVIPAVSPLSGVTKAAEKTVEVFDTAVETVKTVGNMVYYTTLSVVVSLPPLACGYLARAFRRPG